MMSDTPADDDYREARSAAQLLVDEGLRLEKSGELDAAMHHYQRAERAAGSPAVLSEALRRQAIVCRRRGDWGAALEFAARASETARVAGLHAQHALTLNTQAAIRQTQGELDEAARLYELVLDSTNDARVCAIALQNLGSIDAERGKWDTARERFRQSVRNFQRADDSWGEAIALNNYGRAAFDHGNLRMAEQLLEDAADRARAVEDLDSAALASLNLAEVLLALGQLERAAALAEASHAFYSNAENVLRRSDALRVLGEIAASRGDTDTARANFQESLRLARDLGAESQAEVAQQRLDALGH